MHHLFQVSVCDARVRVSRKQDLSLFGYFEPALDSSRRLTQNGALQWSAASTDCSSATVKESHFNACMLGLNHSVRNTPESSRMTNE